MYPYCWPDFSSMGVSFATIPDGDRNMFDTIPVTLTCNRSEEQRRSGQSMPPAVFTFPDLLIPLATLPDPSGNPCSTFHTTP